MRVEWAKELREWLRRLHDEVHVTTIIVTHDQEEAMEVADQMALLHEGRILPLRSRSRRRRAARVRRQARRLAR